MTRPIPLLAPVTITGCLEVSVGDGAFRLSETEGVNAPKSRIDRPQTAVPIAIVRPAEFRERGRFRRSLPDCHTHSQGVVEVATSKRLLQQQAQKLGDRVPVAERQAAQALAAGREDLVWVVVLLVGEQGRVLLKPVGLVRVSRCLS